MHKKLTNFAFVGLLGLNLLGPNMLTDNNATPTGTKRGDAMERIENKIEQIRNTRAMLKEVKVTAVGTSSLTVDNGGTSITINITDKTQLRRRFWGKSKIEEISIGDSVQVIGKWTDDTKTAINAVLIRDESIQKRNGVFFGTVRSLTSTGFVITTIHRDDETVTLSSTSKLINRKQLTITQGDIVVGARVRVRGLWDSNAKTITEVKEVKDFSLPPRASGQAPRGSGEPEESNAPHATPVATSVPTPTASPVATPTATP